MASSGAGRPRRELERDAGLHRTVVNKESPQNSKIPKTSRIPKPTCVPLRQQGLSPPWHPPAAVSLSSPFAPSRSPSTSLPQSQASVRYPSIQFCTCACAWNAVGTCGICPRGDIDPVIAAPNESKPRGRPLESRMPYELDGELSKNGGGQEKVSREGSVRSPGVSTSGAEVTTVKGGQ